MSEFQILIIMLGVVLATVLASNVWLALQERPSGQHGIPKPSRDGTK